MQKIDSDTNLKDRILELELKQVEERELLKEQFHLAYESIQPLNLIKSTFKGAAESEEIKDNILNTSVGLAAGFVSKKLFVSVSHSPIKNLIGTAILVGMTNLVTKNPNTIKSLALGLWNTIRNKRNRNRLQEASNN
jgi:hypothetical protein